MEEHWRMEFPPPALAEVAEQVEVVETIYAQKNFCGPKKYGIKGRKAKKKSLFLAFVRK